MTISKLTNNVQPLDEVDKINELVDGVNDSQPLLVSGTNIKTINNNSLLGSGNIEITTDLSGKADIDLTNVNNAGQALGATWAMPSTSYDDLTLGATGTTYEAPANGYFVIQKVPTAATQVLSILNTSTWLGMALWSAAMNHTSTVSVACKKGETVTVGYTFGGSVGYFRFIYADGEV